MSTPFDAVKSFQLKDLKYLAGRTASFNGELDFLLVDPRQMMAIKEELSERNIKDILSQMGWVVNAGLTFGKAINSRLLEVPRIELVLDAGRFARGPLRSLRIVSVSADSDVILL